MRKPAPQLEQSSRWIHDIARFYFPSYKTNRLHYAFSFFYLSLVARDDCVRQKNAISRPAGRFKVKRNASARVVWFSLIANANGTSSPSDRGIVPGDRDWFYREWKLSLVRAVRARQKKKSGPGGPSTGQKVFRVDSERVSHWGLSEKDPWTMARIGHADRLPSGLPIGALRCFDSSSSRFYSFTRNGTKSETASSTISISRSDHSIGFVTECLVLDATRRRPRSRKT